MRRSIFGFATIFMLAMGGMMASLESHAQSGAAIEVAALVVCNSNEVRALWQANTNYAVPFWRRHNSTPFPACPIRVDVSLIPGHGQASVWHALNVGQASVHMVPQRLITPNAQFCIRVYGAGVRILNDSDAEYRESEQRWSSCDPPGVLDRSVQSGKSTGRPGDGWRKVVIINGVSG